MSDRGDPVIARVSSADASGVGVVFTIYPAGSETARALAATEFFTITDIVAVIAAVAGTTYALVADTDAAGRVIVKGAVDQYGGLGVNLTTPITCPKGLTPRLIMSAAGQTEVTLVGNITSV